MKLTRCDLLELALMHAKIALCVEAVQQRATRLVVVELQAAAQVRELRQEAAAIEQRKLGIERKLSELVEKLSDKYGVDLATRSYDDDTGVIDELDDDDDDEQLEETDENGD